MTFTLFDNEERMAGRAEAALRDLDFGSEEARAAYSELLDAYRKSLREQRRMMRLGDRLQEQLSTANQELARRRAEAERALQQLRDAQDSLIQAEKLASLGGLVAGIAHEINTPIGITVTAASILADQVAGLRRQFQGGTLARSDFEEFMTTADEASRLVLSNANRAVMLIQSFKQVAVDQTTADRRVFALKPYLAEVLTSLSPRLRRAGHTIVVECDEGLEVDGYPGALFQVLTNLVMNALQHAFEAGQTGTIRIAARLFDPDTVEMRFTDDGKGITSADQGRIFDPFFTTKRGAGGSGLGLHIVFNLIVGTLNGSIAVQSHPGEGTTFVIGFPRVAPARPTVV